MMPTNTYQQDFTDIGALISPRPLLIAQANRDGLNTIESVEELYSDIKKMYDLYNVPENISLVETPGGHSYHKISRERIHSFFLKHLMGKDISPENAGDIAQAPEDQLSDEELKVYVDGVPENDRTTTIQNSFVKLQTPPKISNKDELFAFRDSVKNFLIEKTFGAFPKTPPAFDPKMEFRSLDGGKYGWNIYSFVPEEGWRLKIDFHWNQDTAQRKPLMIVLKNYDEDRWESEEFVSQMKTDWNIAYFEPRGIGESGWDPGLQWHVRRAAAWTGRTVASMQVYDLLRCIEYCRTLPEVDPAQIGVAAQNENTVVALYAALMDGNCDQLVIKNPPASQDVSSQTNGKGAATEMLNCLRVTDVYQLPALVYPAKITLLGEIPETYRYSKKIISHLGGEITE
jgi:hypothetical protein